jgi:hypothetical protein
LEKSLHLRKIKSVRGSLLFSDTSAPAHYALLWRMRPRRPNAAWIVCKSCALAIFLFGISWPLIGSSASEEIYRGDSLVAHWRFDEGSEKVVKDASGSGNNGIIVSANALEPKSGTGKFAGSISLDGSTFVRVPPSESLNELKRQITVIAYFYPRRLWTPPQTTVYQRLWRKAKRLLGTATSNQGSGFIAVVQRQWREVFHPDLFYLGYGTKDNVLYYKWHLGLIGTELSIYSLPQGQDEPVVSQWVHLAGTYNGETGEMALYVNGKLIGSQMHAGEIRLDQESLNRPLVIGGELNGSSIDDASNELDGYVADVRLYNRALSNKEIESLAEEASERTTN